MIWNIDRVLILSPHTDDMELGAGSTVRLLVESGAEIKSVVLSDCKKSVDTTKYPEDVLRRECEAAAKHLGIDDLTIHEFPVREFPSHRQEILETIYHLRHENDFDLVLSTWTKDLHQDHRVVAEETLRAFMKTGTNVLAYEVPGNCPVFDPRVYVAVDEEAVQKKVQMLKEYKSQVDRRGYFEINAIKASMEYRGIHVGTPYAEAFVQMCGIISGFRRTDHHPKSES